MGSNIVFILGALLVVGLIVAATMRAAKVKKSPPPSDVVAEPAIQTPPITPGTGEWAIKPGSDTPATLPELPVSTAVEVWNQTGFQVFVTQQGIRATLSPQGRTLMNNGVALTITPASPDDTLRSVALEEASTETSTVYSLIVQ